MWLGTRPAHGQAISLTQIRVPMLHGQLADHGIVTLVDLAFSGMSVSATSEHRLAAGHALIGIWLDDPDEAYFRRVEITLPSLEAMLGPYPAQVKRTSPSLIDRTDCRSTPQALLERGTSRDHLGIQAHVERRSYDGER